MVTQPNKFFLAVNSMSYAGIQNNSGLSEVSCRRSKLGPRSPLVISTLLPDPFQTPSRYPLPMKQSRVLVGDDLGPVIQFQAGRAEVIITLVADNRLSLVLGAVGEVTVGFRHTINLHVLFEGDR